MLIWLEQGGETSRRKAVFTAKRGTTGAHESQHGKRFRISKTSSVTAKLLNFWQLQIN